MNFRTAILGVAIVLLPAAASAQQANRACETLAQSGPSWQIRLALSTFQTDVLGRPTLEWRQEHFDRVIAAAAACDGYVSSKNGQTVWDKDWREQVTAARNQVLPVIEGFENAARTAQNAPRDRFRVPSCTKLLDWRFEPKSFDSNAADLFGGALFELADKDLTAIQQFASDCANPLATYATGRFQIPQQRTLTIADHIRRTMEVLKAAREQYEALPRRPTDLTAKINGFEVPYGLAHERMQQVIRRFNQANVRGGTMSSAAIQEVEESINQVMVRSDITQVDQAFADAIRARINSDIFAAPPVKASNPR